MSGNLHAVRAAIGALSPKGGTALYDAIWKASELLGPEDGRKVLLLLSDGKDEAQSGIEPGSLHTLNEALQRALHEEVMIFAIGIKSRGRTEQAPEADPYTRMPLRDSSAPWEGATGRGGPVPVEAPRASSPTRSSGGRGPLSNQYAIATPRPTQRKDGSWRETRLTSEDGLHRHGRGGATTRRIRPRPRFRMSTRLRSVDDDPGIPAPG